MWLHRHASWKHLNRELQSGPASLWMCLKSSTGLLLLLPWQLHSHTPFQLFLFALAVVFSGQSYVGQRSLWFLWLTLMLLTHQHCNQPQLYEERWIGGNSINGEQMKNLRWTNSSWNSKNLSWHRMYKPANAWYLTNTNNTVKTIQVLNLWASTRSPMISLEFIFGLLRVLWNYFIGEKGIVHSPRLKLSNRLLSYSVLRKKHLWKRLVTPGLFRTQQRRQMHKKG